MPRASDAQIKEHLHNDDGSLRTRKTVASALHAAGCGADYKRILAHLQDAGAARRLSSATEDQIEAHLYNDDGSLRTQRAVSSALHAVGLGVNDKLVMALLHAAGGARQLPSATKAQIEAQLYNDDGSSKTEKAVLDALHASGLGADEKRIRSLRYATGAARQLQSASPAQVEAHLYNDDGTLRSRKAVMSALHASGWKAGNGRIGDMLRAARGL